MKEDHEKEENLISTESGDHKTECLGSVSADFTGSANNFANFANFDMSPQELTNIVNKYKERDENMQDIKYFQKKKRD